MKPTYLQSSPPLFDAELARRDAVDAVFVELAKELGATSAQYPTLISRAALQQAEYPSAFPHLLMVAAHLRDPTVLGSQQLAPENLDSPQWCLSPAVCYHVYSTLANQQLSENRIITARGQCFRNEASTEPGRRQIEFTMREIVLLGTADWVRSMALWCRERVAQLARAGDITGRWQTAEDPFFLPAASGKAMIQRLRETKVEFVVGDEKPLAIASVNLHGDFFGRRFDIRDQEGAFIHTACVAAGIDRWMTCTACHHHEEATCIAR